MEDDPDAPWKEPTGMADKVTMTVLLTEKSGKALAAVAVATGDNWTDSINRAIQVYAALLNVFAQDGEVQEHGAAEPVKLSVTYLPECR